MDVKKAIVGVVASTSLLAACSSVPPTTAVASPDSWVEADALAAAAGPGATAVAGYESAPLAAVTDAQLGPAPSEAWEVTEGHVTIVRYDETE